MPVSRNVLTHILLGIVGWGMVTVLRMSGGGSVTEAKPTTLATKAERPRLDVSGGREILARLKTEVSRDARTVDSPGAEFHPAAQADPHVLWGRLVSMIHGEDGPDLAYAFRHGRMDALEIRDLIAAEYPDHAGDFTFLMALYRELVPHDAVRAAVLLDRFPEQQAIQMKYDATDSGAEDGGPEQCYRIYASIPPSDDPAEIKRRREHLRRSARKYLDRYKSDFTHFAERLPPGQDRDFTLQVIAEAYETTAPAEAERLRKLSATLQGIDID